MRPERNAADEAPARLDRWLWFARFFKSRSRATAFCETGRIRLNGTPIAKPHHSLRPGDVLTFALGPRVRVIRVVSSALRRGPAPEARRLYEDLTPSDLLPIGEEGAGDRTGGQDLRRRGMDDGGKSDGAKVSPMVVGAMLDRLHSLFAGSGGGGQSSSYLPSTLSSAALLLYAAQLDGTVDEAEHRTVADLLQSRFGLGPTEAEDLILRAGAEADAATDLYSLTRNIKDGMSADERTGVIEMLWDVVLSDGTVDAYEANLVRRVAGLLYVSDVDSGAARKRVIDRMTYRHPSE